VPEGEKRFVEVVGHGKERAGVGMKNATVFQQRGAQQRRAPRGKKKRERWRVGESSTKKHTTMTSPGKKSPSL